MDLAFMTNDELNLRIDELVAKIGIIRVRRKSINVRKVRLANKIESLLDAEDALWREIDEISNIKIERMREMLTRQSRSV
ncbi:MAG: hypothetical protein GKR86_00225 [Ilumatobacter sp.]|nr:hypothetical protein [Ilumatobacter sp.]